MDSVTFKVPPDKTWRYNFASKISANNSRHGNVIYFKGATLDVEHDWQEELPSPLCKCTFHKPIMKYPQTRGTDTFQTGNIVFQIIPFILQLCRQYIFSQSIFIFHKSCIINSAETVTCEMSPDGSQILAMLESMVRFVSSILECHDSPNIFTLSFSSAKSAIDKFS